MPYRCPYCGTPSEKASVRRCPGCGKAFLAKSGAPDSPRRKSSRGGTLRPVKPSGPRLPLFRKPFQLLLVVFCLGVLGIGLIRRARHPVADGDPRGATARRNLKTLCIAMEMLREDCGRFPTERAGLSSLVHDPGLPGWNGPYILELKPDPWGHFFVYRLLSENRILILSPGPDGKTDTADDFRIRKTFSGDPSRADRGP